MMFEQNTMRGRLYSFVSLFGVCVCAVLDKYALNPGGWAATSRTVHERTILNEPQTLCVRVRQLWAGVTIPGKGGRVRVSTSDRRRRRRAQYVWETSIFSWHLAFVKYLADLLLYSVIQGILFPFFSSWRMFLIFIVRFFEQIHTQVYVDILFTHYLRFFRPYSKIHSLYSSYSSA